MKVLFLTPWYPDERNPNHGIFVRDQAVAVGQQHEVWVVSGKIDYSSFAFSSVLRNDSFFEGIRESRVVVRKSFPVFNQFNFFLRMAILTFKIGREFRPTVIHGNIGYPGAFWAWIASKLLSVPYIVTEHTRITNNFRSRVHRALTIFGLRHAQTVVAVSTWHAQEVGVFCRRSVEVIPNVIRFDKITVPSGRPDLAEIQIGFMGGLDTPVKGLDLLLEGASGIAGNVRLHIGGTGALLETYKQMARDLGIYEKCIFYGRIPHANVNDFMSRLHVFVNASRWETFGIAMVEALASGVPVVATDSGGPRDFITSDNGLIVPPENAAKLREGVEAVIRNINRYDARAISDGVRAKFSTGAFVQRITEVYARTGKVS